MRNFLLLLVPVALLATSYTVSQNGNWHTATTFTPNGTPGFGDTITNNQYTLTCESGQTCPIGTVNSPSLTLGDGTHAAGFVNNGTFLLRGQGILNGSPYDCTHGPSVKFGTGSLTELDENSTSYSSGFVLPAGNGPCVIWTIGTSGDTCTWGTSTPACPTNVTSINNGSANGILLLDSADGNGTTVMNWNGFALSNCGSASTTVGCFNGEFFNTFGGGAWNWSQGYLNGDGYFGTNASYGMASSIPIDINGVISQGRVGNTDVFLDTTCSSGSYSSFVLVTPACSVQRSITNSLLRDMAPDGEHADIGTMGMTISNVFWDGLGNTDVSLVAANIAGASWSYVVAVTDQVTCTEDKATYLSISAPVADHIYSLCPSVSSTDNPIMLTVFSNKNWNTNISISNVIFDQPTTSAGNAGHCFLYGSDGAPDNGYSVNMSYITVLKNSLGTGGCGFTQWSSVCPAAPTTSITHLLQPAGATEGGFYACEGNTNVATPPALSVYKGNIFYDSSARLNPVALGNSNSANQPANVVLPAGTDYNLNYNFVPFVTTPFTTACAPGCTNNGSPYAVPMTGSAPGAHDLNMSPGVANSRTSYTWAATRGQTSSYTGFRQVFVNGGPSLIGANVAALFYYINQGNIPARPLWNAMPDGTTIGPSQPVMFPGNIRTVTQ